MSDGKAGRDQEGPVSKGLRDAIIERRLTAYAAAKQAGVSVDAIQRFLKEERGLTLATVNKLADALGLSLCPDEAREVVIAVSQVGYRSSSATGDHAMDQMTELLSAWVESARDYAIILVDPDGRVSSWNVGAERILGYTEAEAIGQSLEIFFTQEDRERGCRAGRSSGRPAMAGRPTIAGISRRTVPGSGVAGCSCGWATTRRRPPGSSRSCAT